MALAHLPIIPIMRDIVGESVINMERLEENVEFVEIHGFNNQDVMKLLGENTLLVQLHNGTKRAKLFLLPCR